MSHRLIVLPDDTAKLLPDALFGATQSINARTFLFTDPDMLVAVQAAHERGAKVRVMLNPQRRDGSSDNEDTRRALLDAGVEVRDSSPAFAVTERDYAVVTDEALEAAEMQRCFDADWTQTPFKPDPKSRLIWCPDNGRARIAAFIDAARRQAVAAERALPGHGDHRAPGACAGARRQGALTTPACSTSATKACSPTWPSATPITRGRSNWR